MRQAVQQRQDQQRQRGGGQDAADDHGRQWSLHFGAGTGGQRHRHEAQRGHQRGHQHRPQARHGALMDGLIQRAAFFAQAADEGDHHQPVQHRHPGECNEAHRRRDRHRDAARGQCQDAAGEREGNAGKHQQAILDVVEHRKQQHEHHQQRHRNDHLQSSRGRLQVLELATPGGPVTGRYLDLGLQRLFGIGHEGAQVAPAHVGADHDAALAIFAADLVGAGCDGEAGDFAQRDVAGAAGAFLQRQRDGQATQRLQVGAGRLRQAHHDGEATVTLEQRAGLGATDGGGQRVLDVGDIQAIARDLLAVDIDGEHRQAGGLLDLDLGGPCGLLQHCGDLGGGVVEHRHVVTEDLDRHIATHARDQLVEAQLDRLREFVAVARNPRHGLLDGLLQLRVGLARLRPLRFRLQHDVAVGDVGRHRVRRHLGRAGAGEDALDLGELLLQGLLDLLLHLQRLRQAGAGNAQRLDGHVAFVETGHEFGAQARGQRTADHDQRGGKGEYHRLVVHDAGEQRRIEALGPLHDDVFLLRHLLADEQRNGGRDEGHRQDHRAQQCRHHGEGHRGEHLPFHAGQRKHGQVDDHDDQLAEQQRPARFLCGREDFVEAFVARQRAAMVLLGMGQAPHAVFHDHHGAIDDDAEVQRSQAQQVGADLVGDHAGEGEQHRQRNHHGRDDGRADIAQEDEQHRNDQQRALDQVLLHRGDGTIHQHGAVVDGDGFHPLGQAAIDLAHLLVDRLRDGAAVLADQHEDGAQHHLAAILGGRASAQFTPCPDLGHVADADGHATHIGQHDIADVFHGADLARGADQVLLAASLDVAGADIAVIFFQRLDDAVHGHAVGGQPLGGRRHQEFARVATDGVDLGHARHQAQLRLDDPVLDLAQVAGVIGCAIGFAGVLAGFHGPQVDLAQAGGDRSHGRIDATRQLAPGLLQAFVDQLAGEVDVGAILEDHRHLRQAVARQRADLFQLGQARHGRLQRIADALLGFLRRVAGGGGVDLDLHVGNVGHGVDGQLLVAVDPIGAHAQHRQQDQPSVLDGEAYDAFKHDRGLSNEVVARRPSVAVFGGTLAQFGLEGEAAGAGDLVAGPQAIEDLDEFAVAATGAYRLCLEAVVRAHEDHALVFHRLQGIGRDRHRHLADLAHHVHRDEQAGPPAVLRIGQHHVGARGAGLLADEGADVGDRAAGRGLEGGGTHHRTSAHADLLQVLGRDDDLGPDRGEVGDQEGIGILAHGFAQAQVFLDHGAVEGGADLIAIEAGRRFATDCADGMQLLAGIAHRHLGFLQGQLRLLVVLLGRDLLLPELLLALPVAARQRQALLGVDQVGPLFGDGAAADDGQHLPLLHLLAQVGRDRLHHAGHLRHDVGGAVLVEADLAGQLQAALQAGRCGLCQHDAGGGDLFLGQGDFTLFIMMLALFGMGLFLVGLLLVAVSVILVILVPASGFGVRFGIGLRALALHQGPARQQRGHGDDRRDGEFLFAAHVCLHVRSHCGLSGVRAASPARRSSSALAWKAPERAFQYCARAWKQLRWASSTSRKANLPSVKPVRAARQALCAPGTMSSRRACASWRALRRRSQAWAASFCSCSSTMACSSRALSTCFRASSSLLRLLSNTGIGTEKPTTHMLRAASSSRLLPRLRVRSGTRLLLSMRASARRRSTSRRAIWTAGPLATRVVRVPMSGRSGSVSTPISASGAPGSVAPQRLASWRRASVTSLSAWPASRRALESASCARVCSTGETLPACTRRAVMSAAVCASVTRSRARRWRSMASAASWKATVTRACRALRWLACSSTAMSRVRCAASMRALRLPPSSMGWLIWQVVVRLDLRVSSINAENSGLGRAPACSRLASSASISFWAAASERLPVSARASAEDRVSRSA
eukprot:TRINITY_DN665_c0_g9_i1.p1 TRINITY_DN665_c0_g9~~TRINITY_DN665_c0_g9_i1.p1  ORF type:complete len:1867 (+),score=739.92 TRINITY_DN665_c0_g9_i1:18974-24574(+)